MIQRGRNKELEARCNDYEKRYAEEKASREEGDARIKALKRRIKDLKEQHTQQQQQQQQKDQTQQHTNNGGDSVAAMTNTKTTILQDARGSMRKCPPGGHGRSQSATSATSSQSHPGIPSASSSVGVMNNIQSNANTNTNSNASLNGIMILEGKERSNSGSSSNCGDNGSMRNIMTLTPGPIPSSIPIQIPAMNGYNLPKAMPNANVNVNPKHNLNSNANGMVMMPNPNANLNPHATLVELANANVTMNKGMMMMPNANTNANVNAALSDLSTTTMSMTKTTKTPGLTDEAAVSDLSASIENAIDSLADFDLSIKTQSHTNGQGQGRINAQNGNGVI